MLWDFFIFVFIFSLFPLVILEIFEIQNAILLSETQNVIKSLFFMLIVNYNLFHLLIIQYVK